MNALTHTLGPEQTSPNSGSAASELAVNAVSTQPSLGQAATQSIGSRTGITRLMLTDFRNYDHLHMNLDTRPVVLTGVNGAGKTNIIEALSCLSPGRGLRGAKLAEIGRRSPDEDIGRPWAVSADVEIASGVVRLGTGVEAGALDRRVVHVDGKPARGASAFSSYLGVVWLVPSMDRLFADSPGERRRFVDRLVSALDPEHTSRCAAFDQAVRRRSRLFRDGVTDSTWYAALEDTIARYGVAIAAARRDVVANLNMVLARTDSPFPSAILKMIGQVEDWLNDLAAVDAEEAFREDLLASRQAWAGNGDMPPQSPNRSDLCVLMAQDRRQAAECSTGEQKALLVSIILAHVQLQVDRQGVPPILLLDEVAAHLDKDRQHHLFERVLASGAQAWMTGTDASVFESLCDKAQKFTVADGVVRSCRASAVRPHTTSFSQSKTG